MDGWKMFVISFGGALGLFVGLVTLVFATGATFGQRCGKAYSDPVSIERCVERLNDGGQVYP